MFCSENQIFNLAVTNALSCSRPRLPVGPVPLSRPRRFRPQQSALVTSGIPDAE